MSLSLVSPEIREQSMDMRFCWRRASGGKVQEMMRVRSALLTASDLLCTWSLA